MNKKSKCCKALTTKLGTCLNCGKDEIEQEQMEINKQMTSKGHKGRNTI